MPFSYHLIDAFTSEAFAGNPAAVYLLESWPNDAWLTRVAREMNQSETAFLVRCGDGLGLRWFTPKVEVDLCGHATLASAHMLYAEGQVPRQEPINFETRSGILTAKRRGELIELDFPLLTEQPAKAPTGLSAALGVEPIYVGQSRHDFLVQVAAESDVQKARPDFTQLAQVATRGVIVTAQSRQPEYDFVSRFFAPAAGINEDPVTGSAHCCLASFWQKRLGKSEFVAWQASERGGKVHVRIEGGRAILGGQAVTVATGQLLAD